MVVIVGVRVAAGVGVVWCLWWTDLLIWLEARCKEAVPHEPGVVYFFQPLVL